MPAPTSVPPSPPAAQPARSPSATPAPGDACPATELPRAGPSGAIDGTAELLRRTLPLMSRHAASYAPDSYELWYEYVRGGNPELRADLDALVNTCERLSHQLTFELHRKHLADSSEETTRRAGA
ncbi:MAG: hypothetical protein O9972_15495, partial [Burkholderiales bacterium]|nr:hypothetical protein [Burkholderiales bacterium]